MSKKKATMTLKDFHGGSIPSDLPLPSAPGVIVRPSNHAGFDRQTSWGNPNGRSDYRLRPGSAGSVRTIEDKSPFLADTAHIGRKFDEDERKPLDSASAPRRAVSDDIIRGPPVRPSLNLDHPSGNRPATTPVSQFSTGTASSFAANNAVVMSHNFSDSSSFGSERRDSVVSSQNSGGAIVGGSSPNAWGIRKKPTEVAEPVTAVWSATDTASKLAHASALEKVSSGRWHSKQQQIDVEVIRHPEEENEVIVEGSTNYKYGHQALDVHREFYEAKQAERSLTVENGIQRGTSYSLHTELKERNPPIYADGMQVHPPRKTVIPGISDSELPHSSQTSERPKLMLFPRSKPLGNSEPPAGHWPAFVQLSDPVLLDAVTETYGIPSPAVLGFSSHESENVALERPKLSLKPRSQPLGQVEVVTEKERNQLFGGARPRELVLKERGFDEVAVNNQDFFQSPNRIKQDIPRNKTSTTQATPTRHSAKVEPIPADRRTVKDTDRRDQKAEAEKTEAQRRNQRNENRGRNSREVEKHVQQERPPSPETWRKPADSPAPSGPRHGKAASALELAQAFSRSISDPKVADRFPSPRGVSGQTQIPFSRLTAQAPRPQINGY